MKTLEFGNINIETFKEIINSIPNNNFNWFMLELSASSNEGFTSIKNFNTMESFLSDIKLLPHGKKLNFEDLLVFINRLNNIDECFIVGCDKINDKTIDEILSAKEDYSIIIDYFDSTEFKVYSKDLVFYEKVKKILRLR